MLEVSAFSSQGGPFALLDLLGATATFLLSHMYVEDHEDAFDKARSKILQL
jgi:hypothetical protein